MFEKMANRRNVWKKFQKVEKNIWISDYKKKKERNLKPGKKEEMFEMRKKMRGKRRNIWNVEKKKKCLKSQEKNKFLKQLLKEEIVEAWKKQSSSTLPDGVLI